MELANERLVLRPVDLDDLDFSVELRNRLDRLASPRPEPRPRAEAERQLRRSVEQWQEQGFGSWTVVDRGSSERLGRIELEPIGPGWPEIGPPDEVEVGCVLHPAHWNRGIATEATQLAIEDFFARVGRRRLVALATADNPASLRVLEKLGMRCCGEIHGEEDPTAYLLFELVQPDHSARTPRSLERHLAQATAGIEPPCACLGRGTFSNAGPGQRSPLGCDVTVTLKYAYFGI